MWNFVSVRWYWLVILLVIGCLLWVFLGSDKSTDQQVYTVKTTSLRREITISGGIDVHEKIDLQFKTGGRLAWLGVKEGDAVRAYQIIASLDKNEFQNRLERTLNDYMITRMNFDQMQQDTRRIGDQDSDNHDTMKRAQIKAQSSLNQSVLDIEYQYLTQNDMYLTTPIAGVVSRLAVTTAGVNVSPQTGPIAQVINPKTMYFAATVDQTEVVKLKTGMKGVLLLDAFPEDELPTQIVRIADVPKTGESGVVYGVELSLIGSPELMSKLRLGMTGDATFLLSKKDNVIAIPQGYLLTDGKTQVILVDGSRRVVQTGDQVDGLIEITGGLQAGEKIIAPKTTK